LAFERGEAVVQRYSDRVIVAVSRPFDAQLAKLVNNALSLGTLALAAEVAACGVAAGLDLGRLVDVINARSEFEESWRNIDPRQQLAARFFCHLTSIATAKRSVQPSTSDAAPLVNPRRFLA
jgi:3-hydroxyisobutyrate dehydrogenase-like beta-hydroxyacid dehydrogenase